MSGDQSSYPPLGIIAASTGTEVLAATSPVAFMPTVTIRPVCGAAALNSSGCSSTVRPNPGWQLLAECLVERLIGGAVVAQHHQYAQLLCGADRRKEHPAQQQHRLQPYPCDFPGYAHLPVYGQRDIAAPIEDVTGDVFGVVLSEQVLHDQSYRPFYPARPDEITWRYADPCGAGSADNRSPRSNGCIASW